MERDVVWSTALFALVLGILFCVPLVKSSGVYIHARVQETSGQGLTGYAEHVYLTFPFFYLTAKELHEGKLPLWTPYSCGGTPLIGKQQTGIFSPLHLIFYVIPSKYFPFLWFIFYAANLYLGWIFVFLLARRYGANFWGSNIAALAFILAPLILGTLDECPSEAAVLTPALFYMAEELLNGEKRTAFLFLPWVFALPFLAGHFEVGFFAAQSATLYFLAGLWLGRKSDKTRRILEFAGCAAAGLILSAGQIVAGMQYVAHSYTRIWRAPGYFGWFVDRVSKPLSMGDAWEIAAAVFSLALAACCVRRLGRKNAAPREKSLLWTGALAGFSVLIACLLNLGMTEPRGFLFFELVNASPSLPYLAAGTVCAVLIALALADPELPSGLAVLAALAAFSLLLHLRTPILSNLLYKLPLYASVYLDRYCPDLWIGSSLLMGWALSKLLTFPVEAVRARKAWLQKTAVFLALAAASCALGRFLAAPLAGVLGQGINPTLWSAQQNSDAGGIADAGHQTVYSSRRLVRGWIPDTVPARAAGMAIYRGRGTTIIPTPLDDENGRFVFKQTLDLSPGDNIPVAVVVSQDGSRRMFRGSAVNYIPSTDSIWLWPALAALAVLLLVLAASTWGGLALLLAAVCALGFAAARLAVTDTSSMGAIAIPGALEQEWPFLGVLPHPDAPEPYRIYSPDQYNFPPAVSTIYGISDIRNGDDTMDVFTTVRFLNLVQEFLGQASTQVAARLLGVANVGYVLSRPNAPLAVPGFAPAYSGPDMRVYRNEDFEPFARFYPGWKYVDGQGIEEWVQSGQILDLVSRQIASGALDPGNDLLLNDEPPPEAGTGLASGPDKSQVQILDHEEDRSVVSVNNPKPGFLFLSANHFPGWKAYVDGRRVPILRAWLTFSAVFLPPGNHRVDFIYDPLGVKLALLISALASLIWLVFWGETKSKRLVRAPKSELSMVEAVLAALAVADVVFWLGWCALSYKGSAWITDGARAACAVVIILAARWAMRLGKPNPEKSALGA